MNHLHLTPQQIAKIQSQVSSFDDEEVLFHGEIKLIDESTGDYDKAFSIQIVFLEILILDKWFTLIDQGFEFKGAIIQLTDKQYSEISEKLFNKYD